jgi:hypothetical protein
MATLTRSAAKGVYSSYKSRAVKRGYKFELTLSSFMRIVQSNCIYCDKTAESNNRSGKANFNGIDRINNKKGYISDNVAPCCSMCNYMKASYTVKEFIGHIKKINAKNVLN